MDSWRPSPLSWSISRMRHFEDCRRHYFYDRFWGQDPKTKWQLYEMRNITTLAMLRGQVVHSIIVEGLKSVRNGELMSVENAKLKLGDLIRLKYMESKRRLWHIDNRPAGCKLGDITNLLEHYYNFSNTDDRAVEARSIAWNSIENLWNSEIWSDITSSDPGLWKDLDEDSFPSFELDGIKVYAKIDFSIDGESPTIIDWKTGIASDMDRQQLIVYALYAKKQWGWEPENISLKAVYLYPKFDVQEYRTNREEIEKTREFIKNSFERIMSVEPAILPANIENFPITNETRNCFWCRFQGICEGAKRLSEKILLEEIVEEWDS